MKAIPLHSLVLLSVCALLVLTPYGYRVCAAEAGKNKTENSDEKVRPPRGEKGQKRREGAALKELREDLEKTRHELEKTRDTLHEAHKELGSKAETISSLEAKLSSMTELLESVRDELKKSNAIASTIRKQAEELEDVRKKPAEPQNEMKAVEKKAVAALTASKKPTPEKQPSKATTSKAESSKKSPASFKTPVIAPISYDLASAVNYPERDRALKEVTEALKKSPKARVEITGHADDSNYVQTNEDVSTNRARFLAAYFVLHGIPEERMVVKGLGNTRPLKGQPNRRVEISILP